MKKQMGFSLVETLVVIVILMVLGFLLSDLLIRTFRGGTRTELGGNIKQNGQSALTIMDSTIRNSDAVVCTGKWAGLTFPTDTITVATKGVFTRFRFTAPTQTANGLLQQDNPTLTDPSKANLLCSDPTFGILTNPSSLTDTNTSSGVSVVGTSSTDYFIVNHVAGYKDTVMINFDLSPAIGAGSSSEKTIGVNNKLNFSTTVGLR